MKQVTPTQDADSDVAPDHLGLHVVGGVVLSTLLFGSLLIAPLLADGLRWSDVGSLGVFVNAVPLAVGAGVAATVVGLLRISALRWLGWRAGRQRWPVAGLLLASAGLFALPLLPFLWLLWLLGEEGRDVAHVTLWICAPFLVSYVAATYRLRQRLTAPGRSRPVA